MKIVQLILNFVFILDLNTRHLVVQIKCEKT